MNDVLLIRMFGGTMNKRIRLVLLILLDIILIIGAYYGALWLRFDGVIPTYCYEDCKNHIGMIIGIKVLGLCLF